MISKKEAHSSKVDRDNLLIRVKSTIEELNYNLESEQQKNGKLKERISFLDQELVKAYTDIFKVNTELDYIKKEAQSK